jgi:prepilin-type N-terminal cleavage/methylation domain-containing protein
MRCGVLIGWARSVVRSRHGGEAAGFTLVELAVCLLLMGIVTALTVGLTEGLEQQQTNVTDTVNGARQSQFAAEEVIQYLRAATIPTGVTETSTEAIFPALVGDASGSNTTPVSVTITLKYLPSTSQLQVQFAGTAKTRVFDTYDVIGTTGIFTYYEYGSDGALVPMTAPFSAQCALNQIVAIGIDVSFLAGPSNSPPRTGSADLATTLDTTVFLRNTKLVYGSTTTSTSTTSTTMACAT